MYSVVPGLVSADWMSYSTHYSIYRQLPTRGIAPLCNSPATCAWGRVREHALLPDVGGFLPVGCAAYMPVHRSQRSQAQQPLVGEKSQQQNKRFTPTPGTLMDFQKLM